MTEQKKTFVYGIENLKRDWCKSTAVDGKTNDDDEDELEVDDVTEYAPTGTRAQSVDRIQYRNAHHVAKVPLLGPFLVKFYKMIQSLQARPPKEWPSLVQTLQTESSSSLKWEPMSDSRFNVGDYLAKNPTHSICTITVGMTLNVTIYESKLRNVDKPALDKTLVLFHKYETRYGHPMEARIVESYLVSFSALTR